MRARETNVGMIGTVRRWLAARADAYVVLLAALAINLVVATLALARHLEGVAFPSLAAVYAGLVFVGYYGLVLLVLLTALFALTWFSRRLALVLGGTVLFAVLSYLVVNSFVYGTYRFHVDAFWIHFFFTSYSGIGVPPHVAATIAVILLASAAFQWWVFRLAAGLAFRRRLALLTTIAVFGAFLVSQVIHIVAYYRSDTRITSITPQLPFYSPVVSQKNAAKYGELVTLGLGPDHGEPAASTSLRYPLHAVSGKATGKPPNIVLLLLESWRYDMMDSVVTPNIWALSRRSSVFQRHLSSGNSTPAGVFGLFYGIHPTYWSAVKANNAAIHNPVLIDVLEQNGYGFGIYADSQFGRHKIKDAMFRDITVHEQFAGDTPDARDADATAQLIDFVDREHRQGRPFFGFLFYKSTHYSYRYPPSAARFQPSKELNIAIDGRAMDATPFLNDCRNSVYYTDSLVGRLVDHLERAGLMDETIIIVTSDHGEEFNDNHAGWWGHTGNFTRWQVQVPLVMHVPGRAPREVTATTTHADVPTTLLKEYFGCDSIRDYSNGIDLFGPMVTPRPVVVGSYINHAFVLGEDVHVVYPMFVRSYQFGDIRAKAGSLSPVVARQLLEETHRFVQPGSAPTASVPSRAAIPAAPLSH